MNYYENDLFVQTFVYQIMSSTTPRIYRSIKNGYDVGFIMKFGDTIQIELTQEEIDCLGLNFYSPTIGSVISYKPTNVFKLSIDTEFISYDEDGKCIKDDVYDCLCKRCGNIPYLASELDVVPNELRKDLVHIKEKDYVKFIEKAYELYMNSAGYVFYNDCGIVFSFEKYNICCPEIVGSDGKICDKDSNGVFIDTGDCIKPICAYDKIFENVALRDTKTTLLGYKYPCDIIDERCNKYIFNLSFNDFLEKNQISKIEFYQFFATNIYNFDKVVNFLKREDGKESINLWKYLTIMCDESKNRTCRNWDCVEVIKNEEGKIDKIIFKDCFLETNSNVILNNGYANCRNYNPSSYVKCKNYLISIIGVNQERLKYFSSKLTELTQKKIDGTITEEEKNDLCYLESLPIPFCFIIDKSDLKGLTTNICGCNNPLYPNCMDYPLCSKCNCDLCNNIKELENKLKCCGIGCKCECCKKDGCKIYKPNGDEFNSEEECKCSKGRVYSKQEKSLELVGSYTCFDLYQEKIKIEYYNKIKNSLVLCDETTRNGKIIKKYKKCKLDCRKPIFEYNGQWYQYDGKNLVSINIKDLINRLSENKINFSFGVLGFIGNPCWGYNYTDYEKWASCGQAHTKAMDTIKEPTGRWTKIEIDGWKFNYITFRVISQSIECGVRAYTNIEMFLRYDDNKVKYGRAYWLSFYNGDLVKSVLGIEVK